MTNKLHALQCLVSIADAGSFSAAARQLGVATSKVTRSIAELEAELGVRLLTRSSRRVAMTVAGSGYLEEARHVLQRLAAADDAIRGAATGARGRLRIACPPGFLRTEMPQLLPPFLHQHPQVQLELVPSVDPRVPEDGADVSILCTPAPLVEGDFVARRLARPAVLLAAAPSYIAAQGAPRTPQELEDHAVLMPAVHGFSRRFRVRPIRGAGESGTIVELPEPVARSSDIGTLVALAEGGLGVVALLSSSLAPSLRRGTLVRVLPEWIVEPWCYYAALPSHRHVPRAVKAFWQHLVTRFPDPDADPWQRPSALPVAA